MKFRLSPEAISTTAGSVFITGSMRSGTTMMMRLIASLNEVEMFNEPPILYALFPLIEDIPPNIWRYLLEATLFEDRLISSLRGKNLNLNKSDDACIEQFKTAIEISQRLGCVERRAKVVGTAALKTIAFKLPEMTFLLPRFRLILPRSKLVVMIREPDAVVASMVARGYFSDEEVLGPPVKWPLHKRNDGNFPFWLPEEEHELWRHMGQLARCYRAYLFQYDSGFLDKQDILIDYDRFVANPQERFQEVIDELGLQAGVMTKSLLTGIRASKGGSQPVLDQASNCFARHAAEMYRAILDKHQLGSTSSVER